MPTELTVLVTVAVLVLATVAGLVLRARNGEFRPISPRALVPADGPRLRAVHPGDSLPSDVHPGDVRLNDAHPSNARRENANPADVAPVARPSLEPLGVVAGTPVTLLQFSTAFCAPCRTTRALCADVAAKVPGVRHVEIDAESHLDAVRALDIWRTPTVLMVDAAGVIRSRASGAPTRAQLLAAVADLLPRSA